VTDFIPFTMTYYDYGSFGFGGIDLTDSISRSFIAGLSQTGAGHVTMLRSDPTATLIGLGGLVACDLYDEDAVAVRAFVFIVRGFDTKWIDQGEEAVEVVEYSGPGHLAAWQRGTVGSAAGDGTVPFTDDLLFDVTHPLYDDSAWGNATEVCTVEYAQLNASNLPATAGVDGRWGYLQVWGPMPQHAIAGVGSGTTMIVWASDGTTTGLTTAIGTCWFRDRFTTAGGLIYIFLTADNVATVWLDGIPLGNVGSVPPGQTGNPTNSGFTTPLIVPCVVGSGEHVIVIQGVNYPPFGAPNPGGIAAAAYVPGYPPILLWESTSDMTIMEYVDETPGMTPGEVIRIVLEEQQDAGRMGYLSLDFSDTVDTDGEEWPIFATIATKVGTDCLKFLLEIAATYCDIEMDPETWTLHAWVFGTRNPASGLVLEEAFGDDPDSGNLVSLSHHGELAAAKSARIRYAGGWIRYGETEPQALLELGPQNTSQEISRVAAGDILRYGQDRQQVEAAYVQRGDAEIPWVNPNLVPGSTGTAPDFPNSAPTLERIIQLGATWEQGELLVITINLRDVILTENQRVIRELEK
jgi:hypothetical protein